MDSLDNNQVANTEQPTTECPVASIRSGLAELEAEALRTSQPFLAFLIGTAMVEAERLEKGEPPPEPQFLP